MYFIKSERECRRVRGAYCSWYAGAGFILGKELRGEPGALCLPASSAILKKIFRVKERSLCYNKIQIHRQRFWMTEEKRYECETGDTDGGSEGQGGEERNELVPGNPCVRTGIPCSIHRRKRADAPGHGLRDAYESGGYSGCHDRRYGAGGAGSPGAGKFRCPDGLYAVRKSGYDRNRDAVL